MDGCGLAVKYEPTSPKPILKWAGGKTQLLEHLFSKIPASYGKYIEPFFGGGALFFALQPEQSIIADANSELINLYQSLAEYPEEIIKILQKFSNDEETYYKIRKQDWKVLSPNEAAARTIYLNRTCYNGLYRVNRKGEFNVPFGRYKNPRICDAENIRLASKVLKKTQIFCGDYKAILSQHASEGDFVYLDPPYLPISKYSDFKRYTKEQFYEEDHIELSIEVRRLHKLGCHVILSNSNHPLIHDLYNGFQIEVVKTKRNINSDASKRIGEDIIVTIPRRPRLIVGLPPPLLPEQSKKYPSTRYMGSKEKLLPYIWDVASQFEFETILDLFSGSGVVGYMFKSQGKQVYSNDYMAMAATFATALIENNNVLLSKEDIEGLLQEKSLTDKFVSKTFKGLYFTKKQNALIDNIRANIKQMENKYKRSLSMAALIRACIKKRPRGIFTYVGQRYDDGRKDIKMPFEEHFRIAAEIMNQAVFDNGKQNQSKCGDAMSFNLKSDLVYIDPPYYSPHSDNEYVRRYHFVEGLACNWEGVEMQWHTKTKKFKSYPTPFSSRIGSYDAFDKLFHKFSDSILILSYSSNSLPTMDEIVGLMAKVKKHVEVIAIDHKYSFGTHGHKVGNNNNDVQEYLFIGY